ncbi:single-stranded DNA-binding protein [Metamycoplasma hyosynoviae]|uniref:single-stranded DNA-binding protein n=1 Tax=Metamycoplasma hyosynoviae TaxID=29559 RepID=UPI002359E1B6|nr:single-stranded DNA-binding protein [Metamycoplasma hyosynoviae]MDC8921009.1 single-stranded DNA-binding protein [Metamycoplasma hyosynoviae]MDD1359512.1 single-stranded DNA-binding protein [Metamycoplasma hyosynoviae]MDD1360871.1 single-stranded DNA-binding protein [Metamycoplasma hyosynoviae]MDD1361940.1 single-stranded DNA-binding protein [Metamycoplasma hyosynoviae]MDD7894055.1 single-stranded DNA-binding protein [Metamycoplasma hyosynoviae]
MINKVILSGRIYTIFPNKTLENDVEFLDFIIANNTNGANNTANFIQIKCYGHLAKYVKNYQKVGNFIEVEGELRSYRLENKSILKIIAKKIFCISSSKEATDKADASDLIWDDE